MQTLRIQHLAATPITTFFFFYFFTLGFSFFVESLKWGESPVVAWTDNWQQQSWSAVCVWRDITSDHLCNSYKQSDWPELHCDEDSLSMVRLGFWLVLPPFGGLAFTLRVFTLGFRVTDIVFYSLKKQIRLKRVKIYPVIQSTKQHWYLKPFEPSSKMNIQFELQRLF